MDRIVELPPLAIYKRAPRHLTTKVRTPARCRRRAQTPSLPSPSGQITIDYDGLRNDGMTVSDVFFILENRSTRTIYFRNNRTVCFDRRVAFAKELAVTWSAHEHRRTCRGSSLPRFHRPCWTGLITTGILVRMGVRPEDAWLRVAAARGRSVPDTEEQRTWLATAFRHDFNSAGGTDH